MKTTCIIDGILHEYDTCSDKANAYVAPDYELIGYGVKNDTTGSIKFGYFFKKVTPTVPVKETPVVAPPIKRPPTRNIYHLSYDNVLKVIDFINRNDTGAIESDYANISPGKIHTQVNNENWPAVVAFLNELDVWYEVMDDNDRNLVAMSNGHRKIDAGVVKPEMPNPMPNPVTKELLSGIIEACKVFNAWLKTQRARDILSNRKRKDHFTDNNRLMDKCNKLLQNLTLDVNTHVYGISTTKHGELVRKAIDGVAGFYLKEESGDTMGADFSLYIKAGHDTNKLMADFKKKYASLKNEEDIKDLIEQIVTNHSQKVAEYKSGKKGLLGMFVGEVIKLSKGKADPKLTNRLMMERLDNK